MITLLENETKFVAATINRSSGYMPSKIILALVLQDGIFETVYDHVGKP